MDALHPSRDAFLSLAEKQLQIVVSLAAWCPSMDLLAVVFGDGRVAVHRLNWERLWQCSLSSPHRPTAIAWTPNNNSLTVGCDSGAVFLLASNDGAVVSQQTAAHKGAVTALTWAQEPSPAPGTATGLAAAFECFLNRSSRFCQAPSSDATKESKQAESQPTAPPSLAILGVASDSGSVHYYSASLQALASVMKPSREHAMPYHRVAIQDRFQYLVTLQSSDTGGLLLSFQATAALGQSRTQLRYQAHLLSRVVEHCIGVRQAVANAAEDWGQVNSEMEKLWQKLTSLMADHGCSGSAMAQLMRLMTAGTIPPSLESFLIQNPGERGLRSVARKVDTCITNAADELLDYCIPFVSNIAADLGDVSGLPFSPLVQSSALEAARGIAAHVALRAQQVRLALVDAAREYRRFFTWLLQCAHRVRTDGLAGASKPLEARPVNCAALVSFMARGLTIDNLGADLQNPSSITQPGMNGGPMPPLASKACRLLQLTGLVMPASEASSLELLCQMLEQEAKRAFSGIITALSPTVRPQLRICLDGPQHPQHLCNEQPAREVRAAMCIAPCDLGDANSFGADEAADSFVWAAWPQVLPEDHTAACRYFVCLLRTLVPSEEPIAEQELFTEVAAVEYTSSETIIDCTFFKGNKLVVLLATNAAAEVADDESETGLKAARLQLWSLASVPFTRMPLQGGSRPSIQPGPFPLQVCLEAGAVVTKESLEVRQRKLPVCSVAPPLTVSWARGLCAAFTPEWIGMFDLEHDDCSSDDDEAKEATEAEEEETLA